MGGCGRGWVWLWVLGDCLKLVVGRGRVREG